MNFWKQFKSNLLNNDDLKVINFQEKLKIIKELTYFLFKDVDVKGADFMTAKFFHISSFFLHKIIIQLHPNVWWLYFRFSLYVLFCLIYLF